jgi:hypothetical protein
MTTIGFWREIAGDWHSGYEWPDRDGVPVTDVGANVLAALERARIEWYRLYRVNSRDVHPLFFGLYGDDAHGPLVYHHGGGFRDSLGGRVTREAERQLKQSARFKAVSLLPKEGPFGAVRNRLNPASKLRDSRREEIRKLSDGIFAELQRDEEFWRGFA